MHTAGHSSMKYQTWASSDLKLKKGPKIEGCSYPVHELNFEAEDRNLAILGTI